ncbi:hypothetical protein AS850_11425 [Frondihabitans sp. 762G35]|uniref:hypothetical protein n=1 Tax=Frondihabitans sp. 762G35 TaxID=1446794 RepID=UPI000D20744F|nr:hypothetical protein [Frondihabitans sp. 762G35]ARC57682.1 hypothetical protein AS850_11425 [Frondihabitans sp. 762G35]
MTTSLRAAPTRADPRPTRRESRRGRIRATALEGTGIAVATALGLLAMAHLVLSARSAVLFHSGDSLLMPLIDRSIREGQPFDWAMSSVLFFVPELPVYLGVAAVTPSVQAALVVSGVVTLVALYALLRGLSGVVGRAFGRGSRILLALLPVVGLTMLSLLEHTADRASFELVSLFLTTDYYYGTTLAFVGVVALLVALARAGDGKGQGDGRRRGRIAVALLLVGAAATFDNPLAIVWAIVPALAALALLTALRRLPRALAVGGAIVLVAGTGLGYVARLPFAHLFANRIGDYFRFSRIPLSLAYYVREYFLTASSWQGAAEMALLTAGVFGTVAVTVVALARRWPLATTLGLVVVSASMVVTPAVAILSGSLATRYLMPLFFGPAAATVIVAAHVLLHLPRAIGRPLPRPDGRLVAQVTALALVASALIAGASGRALTTAPATRVVAGRTCVENWIGGRDVTGAGTFWTVRALQTYGDRSVRLLQITGAYKASIWLDDAATYRGQTISYLLVDSATKLASSPLTMLGRPARVVHCAPYTILDYSHTRGGDVLTDRVADSAAQQLAERKRRT